ncbi:MAG: hypothetical protein HQK54_15990, partial [Oligoflexales bacterium]|nr:hypothetical protein [Oligoflexales bacterium]
MARVLFFKAMSGTILLAVTAFFVGLVHSFSPGHWLPVVLLSKARKWTFPEAMLGALAAASGHIFVSLVISIIAIAAGAHFISNYEETIEGYGALMMAVFGIAFAGVAYVRHRRCAGHTHHGPAIPIHGRGEGKGVYVFLFSL